MLRGRETLVSGCQIAALQGGQPEFQVEIRINGTSLGGAINEWIGVVAPAHLPQQAPELRKQFRLVRRFGQPALVGEPSDFTVTEQSVLAPDQEPGLPGTRGHHHRAGIGSLCLFSIAERLAG